MKKTALTLFLCCIFVSPATCQNFFKKLSKTLAKPFNWANETITKNIPGSNTITNFVNPTPIVLNYSGDVAEKISNEVASIAKSTLQSQGIEGLFYAGNPVFIQTVFALKEARRMGLINSEQDCRNKSMTIARSIALANGINDAVVIDRLASEYFEAACETAYVYPDGSVGEVPVKQTNNGQIQGIPLMYNMSNFPVAPFIVAQCYQPSINASMLIMSDGAITVPSGPYGQLQKIGQLSYCPYNGYVYAYQMTVPPFAFGYIRTNGVVDNYLGPGIINYDVARCR